MNINFQFCIKKYKHIILIYQNTYIFYILFNYISFYLKYKNNYSYDVEENNMNMIILPKINCKPIKNLKKVFFK